MLSLAVDKRDVKVAPEKIRKNGQIPAVFYGPKEAATAISVPLKAFSEIWKKAGESSVVVLKDGSKEHEALIHDVMVHPVTGVPLHADFYVVEKGKKVQVKVPLVFTGVAPAIKDKGGILVKVLRELEVEAAPKDLPRELEVDITKLVELTDTIHAQDIKVPAGVTLKLNHDEVVASVSEAKEEVEAPKEIDMASIEVEAKGKEVKEGEAAPAAEAKKEEKK